MIHEVVFFFLIDFFQGEGGECNNGGAIRVAGQCERDDGPRCEHQRQDRTAGMHHKESR